MEYLSLSYSHVKVTRTLSAFLVFQVSLMQDQLVLWYDKDVLSSFERPLLCWWSLHITTFVTRIEQRGHLEYLLRGCIDIGPTANISNLQTKK